MEASDYLTSDDAIPPTPTSIEGWSLKPCPFCGGEAKLWGEDSTWAKLCRVSCTVCYANAGQYVETRAAAVENWNRRPAVLPPTSVEEARNDLARWVQSMNREAFLVDTDALIALVRTEERAAVVLETARIMDEWIKARDEGITEVCVATRTQAFAEVRAMVEGMQGVVVSSGTNGGVDVSVAREFPAWLLRRADILAGLAKMETP